MRVTTSMEKQILLPPAVKREMLNTFKASRSELGRALTYKRNSSRAKALRAAALQRGRLIYTGVVAPNNYIPNVDTHHDHAQGVMRQFFGNRVELCVSRETNNAKIIIDGNTVAAFDDMTLGNWGDVLYSLQMIYNQLNA